MKKMGIGISLLMIAMKMSASLCDQEAESSNNHEFVGVHRVLAALLYQKCGRKQATRLMFEIARRGGLDGMAGVGGKDGAYAEFGLPEDWGDWNLPPSPESEKTA